MGDVLVVAVVNGVEDLLEDLASVLLLEELFLYDSIKELSSSAQLTDEVDVLFVHEVLVQLDHIWMVKGRENCHLLLEPVPVLDLFAQDGLAGPDLAADFVLDLRDDSVGSRAKCLLVHLVDLFNRRFVPVDHARLQDLHVVFCV